MMSQLPTDLANVPKEQIDKEILRAGIIAELDAINLYEQLVVHATSEAVKNVLMDIVKEEKTHVGEFQELLLRLDNEQLEELAHAREEVDELVGTKEVQ